MADRARTYTLGLFIWMAGVTLASLVPTDSLDTGGFSLPYQDKIAHFVFYFVATWLAVRAIREGMPDGPRRRGWFRLTLLALFVFGLLIEALQMTLPTGRSAEWADVLANSLGIVAALASLKRGFHELAL